MFTFAAVDPELAVLLGAVTGLITALGTIWLKNRAANNKSNNDTINNTIKLTETMSNVIDTLEGELDAASKRIIDGQKALEIRDETILKRDEVILNLRNQLHDANVKLYELQYLLEKEKEKDKDNSDVKKV